MPEETASTHHVIVLVLGTSQPRTAGDVCKFVRGKLGRSPDPLFGVMAGPASGREVDLHLYALCRDLVRAAEFERQPIIDGIRALVADRPPDAGPLIKPVYSTVDRSSAENNSDG